LATTKSSSSKQLLWNVLYLIGAMIVLVTVSSLWREAQLVQVVPYTELEQALAAGHIERVVVSDREHCRGTSRRRRQMVSAY